MLAGRLGPESWSVASVRVIWRIAILLHILIFKEIRYGHLSSLRPSAGLGGLADYSLPIYEWNNHGTLRIFSLLDFAALSTGHSGDVGREHRAEVTVMR